MLIDPINVFHLGQIRQKELLQEAENARRARRLRAEPTPISRLRAWVSARIASASPASAPAPCPEVVIDCP